jgi:hypothetical protein
MKIYMLFENLDRNEYARMGCVGTWVDFRDPCPKCESNYQTIAEPLVIEWEQRYKGIGDFTWSMASTIVKENVKEYILSNKLPWQFGKVVVNEHKRIIRGPKSSNKMPSSLNADLKLFWLRPARQIKLDVHKSRMRPPFECRHCGIIKHESKPTRLVICRSEWNGEGVFGIEQFYPSTTSYITEPVLEGLLKEGFKNFWYKEAGIIEDS